MDPAVRRAAELLDAGSPADAVAALRAVLRRDDTDAAAWLLLSEARRRLGLHDARPAGGHRDAAAQAARRAAVLVPASAAPRCALARALLLPAAGAPDGNVPAALAAAREAVDVDDHSVEALLLLADLLELDDDAQPGAASDVRPGPAENPGHAGAGHAAEAARLRERAGRLDPDRAAASSAAAPGQVQPPTAPGRGGREDRPGDPPGTAAGTAAVARQVVGRLSRWVLLPGALAALAVMAGSAAAGRPVATAVVVAALEVAGALAVVAATVRRAPGAWTAVWHHRGPRAVLVAIALLVLVTLVPAAVAVPAGLLLVAVLALLTGGAAAALAWRRPTPRAARRPPAR